MQIEVGSILIHPIHGEMIVSSISNQNDEEYIEGDWRYGAIITAKFDKFIPGVRWREKIDGKIVSFLIFHEFYLGKLGIKNGN